jgi:GAF domain-containing protein
MQASLQLQEILEAALEYSRKIMTGDYVSIMIYDRTIDGLRISARYWDTESRVTLPGTTTEKANNTIAQKAWDSRQLVRVDDLQSDWVWKHPFDQTLHSMLVAPLIAGGVLRGIFEIGQLQAYAFSETDIAAFRQITNQLAVAIDNSETYSQSQRLARNKGLANDIIAHLQQQMDVTSILSVTAQELGKALGAKRARIRLGLDEKGGS